jgi:hypothetical protein
MKRASLVISVVLLAGCGSVTATATAAGAATRSVQLTGTQLAAALVPGSAFPRGYRYDNSASSNSGSHLETGRAKYKLTSVSCANFSNNYGRTGFGETAVAGNSYSTLVHNYTANSGGAYDQIVYQFARADTARSFWSGLHSSIARCPAFGLGSVLGPIGSVTQRFFAAQIPGARAFGLDVTATFKILGQTLVMRVKVWIAVEGQDVFDVDAMGLGRQVPANPTPKTVLRRLIGRVLAALQL